MRKQKKLTLCSLAAASLVLLLNSGSAFALDEIIKNYRGIRGLGMGGLTTTTGNYDEALFGNPARHTEVTEKKITILGATLETNTNLIDDYSKVREAQNASGTAVVTTITDKGLTARNEHARLSLLVPGYYNPAQFSENTGFAFGLLINSQANIMLRGNAAVDSQTFVDIGPNFGISQKLLNGDLSLGLNLHTIYRLAAARSIRATEFLTGSKLSLSTLGAQGFGIDGDVGAFYKLPVEVPFFKKLSLGASVNSVTANKYTLALRSVIKTVGSPPAQNARTFNTGVRADLPDFWIMSDTLAAIEMQDIGGHDVAVSVFKRLHLGTETHFLNKLLAVRLGINEGYVGGGFGFDFPIVKVDFAAYGEELGGNTGQLEDIRLAFRLSFDI